MKRKLRDLAVWIRPGLNRSGRGLGTRPGVDAVQLISGSDIRDGRIGSGLETVLLSLDAKAEVYLLQRGDVLVTGKSTSVKTAVIRSGIGKAVANSTLLVIRPRDPEHGPWIWWNLISARGRKQAESRMTGVAVASLMPSALAEMEIPVPPADQLQRLLELIEASEHAYWISIEAASIRRDAIREHIIGELLGEQRQEEEGVHATH